MHDFLKTPTQNKRTLGNNFQKQSERWMTVGLNNNLSPKKVQDFIILVKYRLKSINAQEGLEYFTQKTSRPAPNF